MPISVPAGQDPLVPLAGFNFHVSFARAGFAPTAGLPDEVTGAFSEVTGLEATMEPKTIRDGGRNYGVLQRVGPVTFSTVILKRGVIEARHLWAWWALFTGADLSANGNWQATSRCDVTIALLRGRTPVVAWTLENAMPTRYRAGDLNARTGEIAIEELHLVHEGLHAEPTT
ncbi:phage tail protein [Paraburkholderia atlantica]|jgi:phage tail-like protein|uniref:phage tail protein n=1 Tax=Paraburkholderia atlantica TaxID=2654982 RepID=UPI003D1C7C19